AFPDAHVADDPAQLDLHERDRHAPRSAQGSGAPPSEDPGAGGPPSGASSARAAAIQAASGGAGARRLGSLAIKPGAEPPDPNSSEARIAWSSARFVSTPSTTHSPRARRPRSIAARRSGACTTSLASSGSNSTPTTDPASTPASTRRPGPRGSS